MTDGEGSQYKVYCTANGKNKIREFFTSLRMTDEEGGQHKVGGTATAKAKAGPPPCGEG
jgi:hypothetical protein